MAERETELSNTLADARRESARRTGLARPELRWLEWAVLFGVAPVLAAWWFVSVPIFQLLWAYAALALLLLWRGGFSFSSLVSRGNATRREVAFVVGRFIVLAAGLAGLFVWLRTQGWWAATPMLPLPWFPLPRYRPGLWAAILVLYPLLSVLPQNVVWRVLFVERYGGLFRGGAAGVGVAALSALSFGWAHVVLGNVFAVAATVVGGWLFVRTYQRTRCFLLASFEHALYGCWMFTLGFGWAFFPATPEFLERVGEQMRAAGL